MGATAFDHLFVNPQSDVEKKFYSTVTNYVGGFTAVFGAQNMVSSKALTGIKTLGRIAEGAGLASYSDDLSANFNTQKNDDTFLENSIGKKTANALKGMVNLINFGRGSNDVLESFNKGADAITKTKNIINTGVTGVSLKDNIKNEFDEKK